MSPDPIGIWTGEFSGKYVPKDNYCYGKSITNEICINNKAKMIITIGNKSYRIKLL